MLLGRCRCSTGRTSGLSFRREGNGLTLVLTLISHGVLAQALPVPTCTTIGRRPHKQWKPPHQEHKGSWDTVCPVYSMSDREPRSLIGSYTLRSIHTPRFSANARRPRPKRGEQEERVLTLKDSVRHVLMLAPGGTWMTALQSPILKMP